MHLHGGLLIGCIATGGSVEGAQIGPVLSPTMDPVVLLEDEAVLREVFTLPEGTLKEAGGRLSNRRKVRHDGRLGGGAVAGGSCRPSTKAAIRLFVHFIGPICIVTAVDVTLAVLFYAQRLVLSIEDVRKDDHVPLCLLLAQRPRLQLLLLFRFQIMISIGDMLVKVGLFREDFVTGWQAALEGLLVDPVISVVLLQRGRQFEGFVASNEWTFVLLWNLWNFFNGGRGDCGVLIFRRANYCYFGLFSLSVLSLWLFVRCFFYLFLCFWLFHDCL